MRFREDTPEEQARAREAVQEWRQQHPGGTADAMLADLLPAFHKDYGPVLRAELYRADLHGAHIATGVSIIAGETR
jgi:hypothetical protein